MVGKGEGRGWGEKTLHKIITPGTPRQFKAWVYGKLRKEGRV